MSWLAGERLISAKPGKNYRLCIKIPTQCRYLAPVLRKLNIFQFFFLINGSWLYERAPYCTLFDMIRFCRFVAYFLRRCLFSRETATWSQVRTDIDCLLNQVEMFWGVWQYRVISIRTLRQTLSHIQRKFLLPIRSAHILLIYTTPPEFTHTRVTIPNFISSGH